MGVFLWNIDTELFKVDVDINIQNRRHVQVKKAWDLILILSICSLWNIDIELYYVHVDINKRIQHLQTVSGSALITVLLELFGDQSTGC